MNVVKNTFKRVDKQKMYGSLVILCWATILLCLVLKLFGSKQFEMPEYTYKINIWVRIIVNYFFYMINSVMFAMLLVKRKITLKETLLVVCLFTPLFVLSLDDNLLNIVAMLETIMYIVLAKLLLKDKLWKVTLEALIINFIIVAYQLITMLYKNININIKVDNFVVSKIMMIDFYTFIALTYLSCSKKGGYIYVQIICTIRRWKRLLVVLPNRKSSKKALQQNLQKESVNNDNGFKLFALMLSVFQFILVFTLCYFINNTTWQFFVIFASFTVMKLVFGKSKHFDSIILCTTMACLVYLCGTKLSLPPFISILCNVLIGLLIAYIMYMWYYYDKYTNSQAITLSRGMSKEDLTLMCSTLQLNEIEERIMFDYYVNKKSLQNIAISVGYSIDNVKKIKAKIIKRIND